MQWTDYFNTCVAQTEWRWPNLATLALAPRYLSLAGDEDLVQTNAMLEEAAKTALRMPQLPEMVIWWGWRRIANALSYRVLDRWGTVGCRVTGEYVMGTNVEDSWRKVANQYRTNGPRILPPQRVSMSTTSNPMLMPLMPSGSAKWLRRYH